MKNIGMRTMALLALCGTILAATAEAHATSSRAEIEAFNQRYVAAHKNMDNAMVSSFWADDGVSLLPEMAPLVGKAAITKFFDEAVKPLVGYHMETMEIDFREIQVVGDWAYEWGLEHQVLVAADGKPPIEGRGNILLILHKNAQGEWKIKREMWNAAPKSAPETKTQ